MGLFSMLYTLVTFFAVSFVSQSAQQWQCVFFPIWTQSIMLASPTYSPTYDCGGSCGDDRPLCASSEGETEAPSPRVANDKDSDALISSSDTDTEALSSSVTKVTSPIVNDAPSGCETEAGDVLPSPLMTEPPSPIVDIDVDKDAPTDGYVPPHGVGGASIAEDDLRADSSGRVMMRRKDRRAAREARRLLRNMDTQA